MVKPAFQKIENDSRYLKNYFGKTVIGFSRAAWVPDAYFYAFGQFGYPRPCKGGGPETTGWAKFTTIMPLRSFAISLVWQLFTRSGNLKHVGAKSQHQQRNWHSWAEAQFCHASAGKWNRYYLHSGITGPSRHKDNPTVHPC